MVGHFYYWRNSSNYTLLTPDLFIEYCEKKEITVNQLQVGDIVQVNLHIDQVIALFAVERIEDYQLHYKCLAHLDPHTGYTGHSPMCGWQLVTPDDFIAYCKKVETKSHANHR